MSGVKTPAAKLHVQCGIRWYAVTGYCRDKAKGDLMIPLRLC